MCIDYLVIDLVPDLIDRGFRYKQLSLQCILLLLDILQQPLALAITIYTLTPRPILLQLSHLHSLILI